MLGLGQVVAAAALGTLLAAVITPPVVRRIGTTRWIPLLLTGGAVAQVALVLSFASAAVVVVGLLLGFVAQAVKICVDTTLQETVEDDYRGRVFSVYDTLFNVTFVVALLLGALTLPPSGISAPMLVAVAVGYLVAAVTYARITHGR
jgi:MFS family permease